MKPYTQNNNNTSHTTHTNKERTRQTSKHTKNTKTLNTYWNTTKMKNTIKHKTMNKRMKNM